MEGLHRRPDPHHHHHHPCDEQPVVASTTPFFDFIDRLSEKATEHQQQRHQGCGDDDEEDSQTPLLLSTVGIRSACPSSRSGTLLMSFARELTANWTQDHHELSECFLITSEAAEASHDHRTAAADHNRPPEPTFRSSKGNDELLSVQSPSSMPLPRRVLERDSLLGYRQAAAALEPKSPSDVVERTKDDRYRETNNKMDSAGAAVGFVASATEGEGEGGSLPWLLLNHSERSDRRLLVDMWLHRWHRIASAAGIGREGGPITTTPSSKSSPSSSSQTAERATVSALSPDEIRQRGALPSSLIQETEVASLKRETQISSIGRTASTFLGPSSSSAVVGVNVASHNDESALSLLSSDNAASPLHSFRKEGLRFLRSRQQHQTQQSHHD